MPVRRSRFIALARQRPNELAFGCRVRRGGVLSGELFKAATNKQMTHIPYRGQEKAIVELRRAAFSSVRVPE